MRLNVILDEECTVWLEEQALAIRRTTGAAVSRSELLRGIVSGLKDMDMNFSRCQTEKDIRLLLAFLMKTYVEYVGWSATGRANRDIPPSFSGAGL